MAVHENASCCFLFSPLPMLAGCGESARQGASGDTYPLRNTERSAGRFSRERVRELGVRDRPWELEDELIAAVDVPLNLQGNPHNRFHSVLTEVRARCVAQAKTCQWCPVPASRASTASGLRCHDSNRDSNSSSQRQTSAVGGTHERWQFAWRLGDTSGLKSRRSFDSTFPPRT